MHTTKEICATNDAILGVDCWHFSVVYFQMCHNLREREQEKVRKLSKEFPTVKFGRVKLWIFWASKVFFFFRSGWMNTKWILSQIKTIEIRNIYLAVEREKKNHPVPNEWIDGAFFSRITKSKSVRMNELHAWIGSFCFRMRFVSIERAYSLAFFAEKSTHSFRCFTFRSTIFFSLLIHLEIFLRSYFFFKHFSFLFLFLKPGFPP